MLRDQHRLPEAGTLERGHPLAHRGRVELCRSERGDRIAWAALLGAVERGQAKVDERRHLGALIGELSRAGKWRGARRCAGQTCAGLTPCRATGPCGAAGARAAAAGGAAAGGTTTRTSDYRSEEHTSELQSPCN